MNWGAAESSGLLWSGIAVFFTGFIGTVAANALFIKYRERRTWIAWVLNMVISILYAPVMFLTLLMMV